MKQTLYNIMSDIILLTPLILGILSKAVTRANTQY